MQPSRVVELFWVTVRPDARSISFEESDAQMRRVCLDSTAQQLQFFESEADLNETAWKAQFGKVSETMNIRRVCKVEVRSAFRKSGDLEFAIVILCDCLWTWLRNANRDVVFSWADIISKLSRIAIPTVVGKSAVTRSVTESSQTTQSSKPVTDMFTARMRNVRHAGYIQKEGKTVRSWKRRFFVLDDQALYYFTSHENVTREAVKGCLLLSDVRQIDDTVTSRSLLSQGKANLFQIVISKRTYFVHADSTDSKFEWIRQLRAALETRSAPMRAVSSESENRSQQQPFPNAPSPALSLADARADVAESDFVRRALPPRDPLSAARLRRSNSDQTGKLLASEAERNLLRLQTARVQERLAHVMPNSTSAKNASLPRHGRYAPPRTPKPSSSSLFTTQPQPQAQPQPLVVPHRR